MLSGGPEGSARLAVTGDRVRTARTCPARPNGRRSRPTNRSTHVTTARAPRWFFPAVAAHSGRRARPRDCRRRRCNPSGQAARPPGRHPVVAAPVRRGPAEAASVLFAGPLRQAPGAAAFPATPASPPLSCAPGWHRHSAPERPALPHGRQPRGERTRPQLCQWPSLRKLARGGLP